MAALAIDVGTTQVKNADISSFGTYVFDTTILSSLQNYAISAGASIVSQLGASTPVLSLSSISKVDSFNLYIQTTANDTSADTWTMHWLPVWLTPTAPLSALTPLKYHVFTTSDNGTKVMSRTQPANTNTVNTMMHVSSDTTATLISAGGSQVTVADPQYMAIVAPYLVINIKADSTSEITINTLRVWGKRREP